MKREGRQHGVVACYRILDPASLSRQRYVKMVDSASAMGLFAKVSIKPTNRSKFTGKCRKPRCNGCHLHPVCKSRSKAKGTMKLRSIDHENELTKYSFGTSATGVLAYLADGVGGYDNDDYGYDNYDYDDRIEESYNNGYCYDYDDDHCYDHNVDDSSHNIDHKHKNVDAITDNDNDNDNDIIDEDDGDIETMSFCDVGLCWGHGDGDEYEDDDDDGWYLVGELKLMQ